MSFVRLDKDRVDSIIAGLGGVQELPFIAESQPDMLCLLSLAVLAIECENSLWIGKQMPHYNAPLTKQKRLGGQQGLSKNAVLPTVIMKQEDREFCLTGSIYEVFPSTSGMLSMMLRSAYLLTKPNA